MYNSGYKYEKNNPTITFCRLIPGKFSSKALSSFSTHCDDNWKQLKNAETITSSKNDYCSSSPKTFDAEEEYQRRRSTFVALNDDSDNDVIYQSPEIFNSNDRNSNLTDVVDYVSFKDFI